MSVIRNRLPSRHATDATDNTNTEAVVVENTQVHDGNDDDNDDDNENDGHMDIQVTYNAPGKRRRTTTLTRWDPHALRRMRQRLGGDDEHDETDRDVDGQRDDGDGSDRTRGNTRDRENDTTRVGVT